MHDRSRRTAVAPHSMTLILLLLSSHWLRWWCWWLLWPRTFAPVACNKCIVVVAVFGVYFIRSIAFITASRIVMCHMRLHAFTDERGDDQIANRHRKPFVPTLICSVCFEHANFSGICCVCTESDNRQKMHQDTPRNTIISIRKR